MSLILFAIVILAAGYVGVKVFAWVMEHFASIALLCLGAIAFGVILYGFGVLHIHLS